MKKGKKKEKVVKEKVEKVKPESLYAVVMDYIAYRNLGPVDTPERQAGIDVRYQKLKELVKAK